MKSSFLKVAVLSLVILLGINMSGCVRVDTGTALPTLGQQLIDLAKAKRTGMISEQEFHDLKLRIVAQF